MPSNDKRTPLSPSDGGEPIEDGRAPSRSGDPWGAIQPAGPVVRAVAENLYRIRTQRRVSLTQLAKHSGVAKATLSALEAGRANPTIETLWALASALSVPFSQLVSTDNEAGVRVMRRGEGIRVPGAVGEARLLHRLPSNLTSEIFELVIAANACYDSLPHAAGVQEHLIITRGALEVGPKESPIVLKEGDFASFPADVEHIYKSVDGPAHALVIMSYPGLTFQR